MQWNQLLSERRLGKSEPLPSREHGMGRRSQFERDYDRLVFSASFRRLQNKAQVFPLPGNVFVHNRLTHSLEVSCVGRSLGNIIGDALLEKYGSLLFSAGDLAAVVSAACLAHDMGNPPFGHSGERAISAYFREGEGQRWQSRVEAEGTRWQDFAFFEGNANTFRLLTHRFEGRRPGGFALTYSTLAAIVKYPWGSNTLSRNGKFGFFEAEESTFQEIATHLQLLPLEGEETRYARHPLVFLVEAADDICYQIMDLEDAYKLRLLTFEKTFELLHAFCDPEEQDYIRETAADIKDKNEVIAYLRSKAINQLVAEAAEAFLSHEEEILAGTHRTPLLECTSPRIQEAYNAACKIAWQHIYTAHDVVDVELAGHRIFSEIIERMMYALEHPQAAYSRPFLCRISSQYDINPPTLYGKILTTLDYISGMTDLYALDLYRKLTGMNLPHV